MGEPLEEKGLRLRVRKQELQSVLYGCETTYHELCMKAEGMELPWEAFWEAKSEEYRNSDEGKRLLAEYNAQHDPLVAQIQVQQDKMSFVRDAIDNVNAELTKLTL